jgi:hypothetical protein
MTELAIILRVRAGRIASVPVYEEDTEVLEFSPQKEYQQTIDIVAMNIGTTQTANVGTKPTAR